jgi:hypothetical protein
MSMVVPALPPFLFETRTLPFVSVYHKYVHHGWPLAAPLCPDRVSVEEARA